MVFLVFLGTPKHRGLSGNTPQTLHKRGWVQDQGNALTQLLFLGFESKGIH